MSWLNSLVHVISLDNAGFDHLICCAGAKSEVSKVTENANGLLEQKATFADCSSVTEDCHKMDRRADQRYLHPGSHPSTPGVRYVTPVGSSLQTPFDASRHHSMLNSHNFHSRDAGQFRPPSLIFNPISGAHSMPEATPFQAIVNPQETGYNATHSGVAAPRSCSWRMSPSRGQIGGFADGIVGVGKTPWFRRTPGARRPNTGSSPQSSVSCQSVIVPRPLFPPSSCARSGMSAGTYTSNTTVPFREYLENDLGRAQSVSTAPSYPASVKPRSATESTRFDASSNVADGVELVVSNLDYNISAHEWKKILTCELQQQVQVCYCYSNYYLIICE